MHDTEKYRTPVLTGIFILVGIFSYAQSLNPTLKESIPQRPHIILIVVDDLGYGDLSAFGGGDMVRTPHIDRLVDGGMKFTDFHTNGVVCSPTRASLMTGLYPQEAGIESVVTARHHRHTGMSPDHYTLAEFLKESGYTTALFGKWHLGYQSEYGPIIQGFDYFRGFVSGNVDYFSHIDQEGYQDWWNQDSLLSDEGYLTDLITDYGIDFIENVPADRPFFLYLAHGAPHYPYQSPDDEAYRTEHGKFNTTGNPADLKKTYREMIESLDQNIGRIVGFLEDQNLLEETLILFLSDNGATLHAGSNYPFRGGKSSVWEGGHRVPAVCYWKGQIEPGTSDELVMTMDVFPTIAELPGIGGSEQIKVSGSSFMHYLFPNSNNSFEAAPPRTVFWRWSAHSQLGHQKAARQGQWKLVINPSGTALYDLDNDQGETTNIKSMNPEKANELLNDLNQWEDALKNANITVSKIE